MKIILLVENNARVLRTLAETAKTLLDEIGTIPAKVLIAGSREEVIDIFSGQYIDLLIVDHDMPGTNGFDSIKLLCNEPAKMKTALMVERSFPFSIVETVVENGISDVLVKPVERDRLKEVLLKMASP